MLSLLETTGMQLSSVLEELDEYFPPVNPSPDDTLQTIMYKSGQRSVVEWIQRRLKDDVQT